jgi:hypothetical protein
MPDLTLLTPTGIGFHPPSTIERRVTLHFAADCIAKPVETSAHVTAPGNQPRAIAIDVSDSSESVHLQFIDVLGVVEWVTSKDRAGGDDVGK